MFIMPSSHCSPCSGSTTMSPHACSLQVVRHAASGLFELPVPRSHCSNIVSTMPLPQTSSDRQSAEQPSPEMLLPSSQTSPRAVSTTLLPHTSVDLQSAEQPSPDTLLP